MSSVRDTCPNGYLAIQFSADFGDDRTLDEIARGLDLAAASHGLGVVFFRAGIAPCMTQWRRTTALENGCERRPVSLMTSPNVWDICAVIAGSRAYCGSSLHGSIVAAAFSVPHVNLRIPRELDAKQANGVREHMEDSDWPGEVGVEQIAQGIEKALRIDSTRLAFTARRLVAEYRAGFAHVVALTA
ncbi:polysaccharide pyruvyl transferase family protein [Trinickia sp. NRRL B-1857]|uniref:polysaccharide pyruvyl transferase family protein n=1 Tax=Trinickia sp. NRRL B-1857 TaxID=3162879 RepID=UPI003D2E7CE0